MSICEGFQAAKAKHETARMTKWSREARKGKIPGAQGTGEAAVADVA
jgi:hypothetical protein